MKFFKHFTDAHRGKSLRAVKRELGMAGLGMYWSLVELCAEKLEKDRAEEYTEAHCSFEFDLSSLSECLGVKSGRVQLILKSFSEQDLLHYSTDNFIFKIEMPKLLESIDRDSNRARIERVPTAPKKKNKIKNKEEDKDNKDFDLAWNEFKSLPGVVPGPKAKSRFAEQIKSQELLLELLTSIANYKTMLALPQNDFRSPKASFETFLGTKKSGFFWRDYVAWENPGARVDPSKPGTFIPQANPALFKKAVS